MPLFADFCGGTYEALSPIIGAEQAVNVFLERRAVPGSPKQATLYGTPGLVREATLDTLGCRGWFTMDGRTFTVYGDVLYERTAPGSFTSRGTISDDGLPVSFASNGQGGNQIAIVGGGDLYIFDTSTDTLSGSIALPFNDPVTVLFIDTYFLINQRNTPIVWYSGLEDGTSWDALDFFTRSGTSDNIVTIATTKARVFCIGTATTTQFYNSGDADTPFLPYPGTVAQVGIVNASALFVAGDVLTWIAQTEKASPSVVTVTDGPPQPVSTPPIALFLENCTTLGDAELMGYTQGGHAFVAMTCPSSPDAIQTYVFDQTEGLWHARAGWDSGLGTYYRWRARGCAVVDGTVLVGDYQSGKVYTLELDAYDDDGEILMAERTAPYLGAENQVAFLSQVELGMQAGVGLSSGQGSDPQVELQISRDGAQTWVSAGFAGVGAIGEYGARTIWRRLGRARLDRLVLRVRQSDPVKRVWGPGMWIRLTAGTGQR